MTPSDWHDDAKERDAGHDEMQFAVWRWLKSNIPAIRTESLYGEELTFILQGIYPEFPIRKKEQQGGGSIMAFADIAVVHQAARKVPKIAAIEYYSRYLLLEVKPRIYSVGALLRQQAALEDCADRSMGHHDKSVVIAIVKSDDPKLHLLLEYDASPVATWDGSSLNWHPEASNEGAS